MKKQIDSITLKTSQHEMQIYKVEGDENVYCIAINGEDFVFSGDDTEGIVKALQEVAG